MKPDKEALMTLRPLELAAYLRSRGWREVEQLGERASVWKVERKGEELELLLPLDPTLGDYISRMAEVVSTLETVETRPRSELLDDVAAATADTVRFRFLGPGHSVTVEHGVHIHENVRDLMLAAVSFSADTASVLREAARVFRASAPREEFELEGLVIRLERDEGAATGTVTIAGVVDSHLRKVRLELEARDYPTAIEAHLKGRPVRCEGELVREGRTYILGHPRQFALKPEERGE